MTTSFRDRRDRCGHSDVTCAYALQSLPGSELAAAEAHIASCPECQRELESLRPVLDHFVSWPTDVLRPTKSLQTRLALRIAEETGKEPVMPPAPQWYAGRQAIFTFFAWAWKAYEGFRLIPTGANCQPAFAAYSRASADAPWAAHSVHVLSLERDTISALTLFYKPSGPRLLDAFGLPLTLPAATPSGLA